MRSRHWAVVLFCVLESSCASHVKLAAPYDPVTDNAVTEFYVGTLEFLGMDRADDDYPEALAGFQSTARAMTTALEARAQILEHGLPQTPLADNFASLKQQLGDLVTGLTPGEDGRALLDNPRVFDSTAEAIDQSFRAIMRHLVFLRDDP